MYLQKVIGKKLWLKNYFLLDPDLLVRGNDPRIQIRTKMSWIRNTEFN
jgi:hypothetical protein